MCSELRQNAGFCILAAAPVAAPQWRVAAPARLAAQLPVGESVESDVEPGIAPFKSQVDLGAPPPIADRVSSSGSSSTHSEEQVVDLVHSCVPNEYHLRLVRATRMS